MWRTRNSGGLMQEKPMAEMQGRYGKHVHIRRVVHVFAVGVHRTCPLPQLLQRIFHIA